MNYGLRIKNSYLFFVFIFLVSLDQLSKYLIRSQGGFYICNEGIAFGMKMPEIFFWIFWVAIFVFLIKSIVGKDQIQNIKYQVLILAGAISNVIDRLYFGCVIDFIDLKIWPVFNLADVFITFGAIFLLYSLLKKEK